MAEIRAATAGPLLVQALASAGIACGLEAPETNAVCPGALLFGIEPAWLPTPARHAPRAHGGPHRRSDRCATSRRARASGTAAAASTARPTRLGALPIGYSNSILVPKAGQKVRVEGRDAPVLSVSLEHAVVDVSDVESARAGAPVCLLASEPAAGPTLAEVASRQGRSPRWRCWSR